MKYIVILGDGMADYHRMEILNNKTPLEVANTPTIDMLAREGLVGSIKTVDDNQKPGSDVANLSVLGYDPNLYYTGRSPLEALNIGVDFDENDMVFRVNLVTLGDEERFEDKTMVDYSSSEISTTDARDIIEDIEEKFAIKDYLNFYTGTSYRHCAKLKGKQVDTSFTPPHDILGKKIGDYLPSGEDADFYKSLMQKSYEFLSNHLVNEERKNRGKNSANALWFWGSGTRPLLPSFESLYGLKGAMISAVDLLKGIAKGAGLEVIEVRGATGTYETNFQGKAEACVKALETNDYVYVHMEAPDECGHQGDAEHKVYSIEQIDGVVKYIYETLTEKNEEFCMAILPDHATPLCLRTHTSDPVPFVVYNSARPAKSGLSYSETESQKGIYFDNGRALIQYMIKS